MPTEQHLSLPIERIYRSQSAEIIDDHLAIEEPLEIRVGASQDQHRSLSITMRTPGDDSDLAAGFLWTEGLLQNANQIEKIVPCGPTGNVVRVQMKSSADFDWEQLNRHFYMTSSCGVCGKSSIEALQKKSHFERLRPMTVDTSVIYELPEKIREAQSTFEKTGGLHAATLFSQDGVLVGLKEDVGRHNALDKLIGSALKDERLPLDQHILVLSGRASFELIQKAYMAGLQFVVAIGAPSSLAAQLAKDLRITLVGFTKSDRFNVYTGKERIGDFK